MSTYKDETGRNPIASRNRTRRAEGEFTQTDGEARGAWIDALREAFRAKPSRFITSLLSYYNRTRHLPTPKQLAAVNDYREREGLPRVSCRVSDPSRPIRRASAWRAGVNQAQAVLEAARPLKPPGR